MLGEVWKTVEQRAEPGTKAWSDRLRQQLREDVEAVEPPANLSDEARETLDPFELIAQHLDGSDPQAIGAFILSMTTSADDLLAVHLLLKSAGGEVM